MNEFPNMIFVYVATAVISYLIGSLNMAILISKFHKSKDIRDYGSGNAGMTNMLRTFGKRAATWTFVGDFLKGAIVVFIAREIGKSLQMNLDLAYIAALFVMLGHIYPLYFGFKGGKGIATALGAMFVLNWIAFVTIAIGIAPMVFIIKIVSAVCLCGASLYPVLNFVVLFLQGRSFFGEVVPYTVMSLLMALLVFYAHRDNIKRLRSGTEPSFGRKNK
ncbi:MAG: glycerol-3-phosphate 1-O-acyltransferase PlsY [Oscillospiraceae bacterium]|nr:glycerol-3-phosphate 1-O-acyltransferase PlsY [Oscillospiraceae bacterium]MBP1574126.1 glycerol-3-phosphate 1-O-acyltransferase PlsY [Oscillospiraceae bacterium]MBQ5322662.1 glycerol-3-phosphate 1-O-acyltransferase PlsY [Oscillospiraceae bacterium]MBQ8595553.1 glycerol-3-phosphate 1-O-acyltransferase PlsY [Oscillospiraceae bacterium]